MSTVWPSLVNSSTPTGTRATRDSCVLISLGTPTTYFWLCGIGWPRRNGAGKEGTSCPYFGETLAGNQDDSPPVQSQTKNFALGLVSNLWHNPFQPYLPVGFRIRDSHAATLG